MNVVGRSTIRPELQKLLAAITSGCPDCGICVKECAFLQKYGTPKSIAARFDTSDPEALSCPFGCSLCGLCTVVCPKALNPAGLFLEMRRQAVDRDFGYYPEHRPLLNTERIGTSKSFTLYRIPAECVTVFFPGCSLSGSRPRAVKKIFAMLRRDDPTMGIVFDCCSKSSHSLGHVQHACLMFAEMNQWLIRQGVKEVLVACPNCQEMFMSLGEGLKIRNVWEVVAASGFQPQKISGTVTVHDPCVIRDAQPVHQAVRTLLERQGLTVEEMPHSGRNTVCCGQGGAVHLLNTQLAASWRELRKREAAGRRIITYCAGCARALGKHMPTSHLADVLFTPAQALAGKVKDAKPPFTYLNRLLLKRDFKREEGNAVMRERVFIPDDGESRKRPWKPVIFLILLAAAVVAVHLSGASRYLQKDRLQELIAAYGALAPTVYILIYTLAPVLFLPGLPITIVGGILFGPFWGVVYAITGASLGASLAFLVARYIARDWITAKLTGSRWKKLDSEVARNGWKAVAFTRLIPIFPFNLLNYAFGLTKIPFPHYVAATFVFMLPACVAFIVFSSSLPELIVGTISPVAVLGIALIVLVLLIPVIFRYVKNRHW
jgi:uncharacterized membrane protein YdjX (TVP38/TMEM64 family)/Fe-S oxidoreductase